MILLGKRMDFDASPDEEYGPTELDQMIQDEFFDSSNSDEEVDMVMLMSMQEEMDRQVEHILNFKGSIKRRRVINRDRVSGARLLQRDYLLRTQLSWRIHGFVAVFAHRNDCFCALWREWRHTTTTSSTQGIAATNFLFLCKAEIHACPEDASTWYYRRCRW